VSLGQLQSPRKEFERAARQPTAANHSQTTHEREPEPAPNTPQPEALT
jgi:hypothetical protein